jgi:hypothetical protein
MTGEGGSAMERKSNQVNCHICQKPLKTSSLARHLTTIHQIYCKPIQEIPERLFEDPLQVHKISMVNDGTMVNCPVNNCPGHATTRHNMRRHFAELHPMANIIIENEGPLPRCTLCKMFVTNAETHGKTQICNILQERRQNEELVKQNMHDNQQDIKIGNETIEKVDSFLYLGRWMMVNDSDEMASISNIRKAQNKWRRIFPILTKEGANPKTMTPFYKAVVLSSLL